MLPSAASAYIKRGWIPLSHHAPEGKWRISLDPGLRRLRKNKQRCLPGLRASGGSSKVVQEAENVVIVGGGISGLATALALHRVGMRCVVLEQGESLRTAGTTITLWSNGWRALDVLGVADGLRSQFTALDGVWFYNAQGKIMKEVDLADARNGLPEVRNVERRELLKALAAGLPAHTIRYNSKVVSIRGQESQGRTEVVLEDGAVLNTKVARVVVQVVVGCDGVRSVVGKWMKLAEPKFVGQIAIRGLAVYPQAHNAENKIRVVLGQGVIGGYIVSSPHTAYWYVCFNQASPGASITDPKVIKQEALSMLRGFPSFLLEAVDTTPPENLARSSLRDRWTFPYRSQVRNGVTVAGDASHPMTPNLGQGGCCALEDGVIFARELHRAFTCQPGPPSPASIAQSLEAFSQQRWHRKFPVLARSGIMGFLLLLPFPPICFLRDNLAIPLVFPQLVTEHTLFDCGRLPSTCVTTSSTVSEE